jgi:hypothetical protein
LKLRHSSKAAFAMSGLTNLADRAKAAIITSDAQLQRMQFTSNSGLPAKLMPAMGGVSESFRRRRARFD